MDNIEQVVRAAAARRADGTAFPDPARWPEGWVHLSTAVACFAEAWINEGSGFESAFHFCLNLEAPELTDDLRDEWQFADHLKRIAEHIAEQFVASCRHELLVTGHRRIGGGDIVQPMPSDWWDTEDVFLRFRTWSIDPSNEISERIDLPHWIWVDEDGLKRLCRKVSNFQNNVKTVTFVEEDTLISVSQALDVLAPFLPYLSEKDRARNGAVGAQELRDICASGAVKALAGRMERRFDAVGLGGEGKLVEADNDWAVPAKLWASIELSPLQNWASGTLIATPTARNWIKLERVAIDWRDLTRYLEGQKLLLRVQFKHTDEEEPFAEGFTPAVPVEFGDPDMLPCGLFVLEPSGDDEHFTMREATELSDLAPSEPKDKILSRGVMPRHATKQHRRHEEVAHQVAPIVRAGATIAEAIRQVFYSGGLAEDPNFLIGRQPGNVERAIRESFTLMYDKRGNPHP